MSYLNMQCIGDPEFINVTSVSPLISECEIKVLYLGQNRNGSFISKEVATKMAETLPGSPIVGHYIESKQDFGDHGEQLIIDDEGLRFNKLTRPYGFVAPTARIWFQKFTETDMMGNTVEREYLMTTGYLWTGKYPECKRAVEEGNPHSMELDEETLEGTWATQPDSYMEFFIINDAVFSALCILGEDVEPCFEGSEVTAPQISSKFSADSQFNKDLATMMTQLKNFMLQGGFDKMENQNAENTVALENPDSSAIVDNNAEYTVEAAPVAPAETATPAPEAENFSAELGNANETETANAEVNVTEDFAKEDDKKKEEDDKNSENKEEDDKKEDDKKKEEEDKFALLSQSLEEQKAAYAELEAKYQALVEFKNEVDLEKKNKLISEFSFLSEEDLADVKANISNYSLDEIESKLSVIAVRKKVNFSAIGNDDEQGIVNLDSLNNIEDDGQPAWVKAVQAHSTI